MWVHLVQNNAVWKDPIHSLKAIDLLLKENPILKEKGGWLLLPEMFAQGFVTDWNLSEDVSLIKEQQIFILQWMQETANKYNLTVAGSMAYYENERLYNRLIAVQAHKESTLQTPYNKKHRFGLAGENRSYHSGSSRVLWHDEPWCILPSICYDLRFPVWLRYRKDYQLLFCVANWPQARVHAWRSLLMARAIENQAYVVGVNRVGTDATGTVYSGESMVLGPDGSILLQMNHEPGIGSCFLDIHVLNVFRRAYPFLNDADSFQLTEP
jgi:predicted amidohydrolase